MIPAIDTVPAVHDVLATAILRLAAAGIPEARADAEVLLAHTLGTDRTGLIVRARQGLDPDTNGRFEGLVARRAAREPVAYILGTREFWSLPFAVDPRVLIPRPETEIVVETALDVASHARRILDVGTGCGAIAVALACELPGATVVASDRMRPALEVAARNCGRLAPRVRLVAADLVAAFGDQAFDLVVTNPPYCAEGTVVQAEVRDWEPVSALYAGPQGLDALAALARDAARVLAPGGWLVMELGVGQATVVARLLDAAGSFGPARVARDFAGIERVVAAERRAGC
ncbi:MAG: peptide chain release factor N(5)-glutamine methyltransferase [Candidatus Binatia bacterium]